MSTKAIILAAGRGSRLGNRSVETPKPLLQVGPKYLVEHQLEMLATAGIGPVTMVLGYQGDEIIEIVGQQAEYVVNPKWSTTNSLYSFLLAESRIDSDVVIMNCDILLDPEILDRLLEAGADSFAYDSASGQGREHMKITLRDSALVRMSKQLSAEESEGENVGILYLSKHSVRRLVEYARERIEAGFTTDWIGGAVQELAREVPLRGVDIAGLPWAEIDFAYDLVRARKEVWPSIRDRKSSRRSRRSALSIAATGIIALLTMVGFARSSATLPLDPDWDTVVLSGAKKVYISNGERQQRWWITQPVQQVTAEITGPDTVRVESRIVLDEGLLTSVSYVVAIKLDGHPLVWDSNTVQASKSTTLNGLPTSKLRRKLVAIPEGVHSLSASIDAVGLKDGLIRIRQIEAQISDDE